MFQLVDDIFGHRLLQVEVGDLAHPWRGHFGGFALHDNTKLQPAQHDRRRQRLLRAVALAFGIHLLPKRFARGDQLLQKFIGLQCFHDSSAGSRPND